MNKEKIIEAAMVLAALAVVAFAVALSGCYVGKASFQGENMHMYPLFGTMAEKVQTSSEAANAPGCVDCNE